MQLFKNTLGRSLPGACAQMIADLGGDETPLPTADSRHRE